jgi:hypothetical protein
MWDTPFEKKKEERTYEKEKGNESGWWRWWWWSSPYNNNKNKNNHNYNHNNNNTTNKITLGKHSFVAVKRQLQTFQHFHASTNVGDGGAVDGSIQGQMQRHEFFQRVAHTVGQQHTADHDGTLFRQHVGQRCTSQLRHRAARSMHSNTPLTQSFVQRTHTTGELRLNQFQMVTAVLHWVGGFHFFQIHWGWHVLP